MLAFDRTVVINALSKVQEGFGLEYLEKVVQVPFEVPAISKEEVHILLLTQLSEQIKDIPTNKWDQNYWANLWHAGLKHLFNSIRDVTRYVNSLRFSFQMVKGEVNPVDFLAITALQVFLPEVYYGVRDNKDVFAGMLQSTLGRSDSEKQQAKQRSDEVMGRTSHLSREYLQDLLTRMFPKLEGLYGNTHYSHDWLSTWRGDCRICSPDLFDIYFRLHVPTGEMSQTEIETILSLAANREGFSEALLGLNKEGRIIRFLERLEDFTKEKIPQGYIDNVVCTLVDIGDLFPDGESGFFTVDTPMRILQICYQLSQRLADQERRFQLFRDAIQSSTRSLHILVHEVSVQDQQHGRDGTKGALDPEDKRTVNATQLDELEKLALEKIKAWAQTGRLAKHPKLPYILYRWKRWGNAVDVQQFVETMISADSGLVDFVSSFLQKSTSYSGSDYVGKEHWRIPLKNLEDFVALPTIETRVRGLLTAENHDGFAEKQKLALQVLVDTIDGKIKEPY